MTIFTYAGGREIIHTYRKQKDENVWTVGLWLPHDTIEHWHPIRDFPTELQAAQFTSFLNGGDWYPEMWPDDATIPLLRNFRAA